MDGQLLLFFGSQFVNGQARLNIQPVGFQAGNHQQLVAAVAQAQHLFVGLFGLAQFVLPLGLFLALLVGRLDELFLGAFVGLAFQLVLLAVEAADVFFQLPRFAFQFGDALLERLDLLVEVVLDISEQDAFLAVQVGQGAAHETQLAWPHLPGIGEQFRHQGAVTPDFDPFGDLQEVPTQWAFRTRK